jgi:hypothetical protein
MKTLSLLLLSLPIFAYSPDYFPLQVGNEWVYRTEMAGNASFSSMRVTGKAEYNGREYAVVEGLGGRLGNFSALLRQDDNGVLWIRGADGVDQVYAAFATPEGGEYGTAIDSCTSKARVASRAIAVETPTGKHEGALQVVYTPNCADAGVTGDWYLPWIGLVRRESTSFAGPRVMTLVYSRTGVTELSQPEASFGISVNQPVVRLERGVEPQIEARLRLRVTAEPVELRFPSGQRFDFSIQNERGESVYTWSATRLFAAVAGEEIVGSGERNWVESLPLSGLPAGKYTLEGWLAAEGGKRYAANIAFEIAAPR